MSYWKTESQKNCLWWYMIVSCISHSSGKVLPRTFLNKVFFRHIKMAASEIRNNQSFLIQLQVARHHHISFYRISAKFDKIPEKDIWWCFATCDCLIQTFYTYYYYLQSSFSQSYSVLVFAGMKRKCYSISVKRSMLISRYITGTYFSSHFYFNTHNVSAIWKSCFHYASMQ